MEEWTHKVTMERPYYGVGYRRATIKVGAGLNRLEGNRRPHFSVTGEIWERGYKDCIQSGCIHREILQSWPQLAPVIALHLSDDRGTPVHAAANGWYHLAGYYGGADERYHAGNGERQHWLPDGTFDGYRFSAPMECLSTFAEYVRVSLDEAKSLADSWRCDDDWASSKRRYLLWLDLQAQRWQNEADAAIRVLDSMVGRES